MHIPAGFILIWGLSLTDPMLSLFLCGKFLLHIPCLFGFSVGSFSYPSHAVFVFVFNLGSFSYTSRAGCIFMQGVSLTHPVLALFLSGEFLFIFIWGVSLTHPVLAFCFVFVVFSSGEFLLHNPCWILFFIIIWDDCLTHTMLGLFLCGEFLLHVPGCFLFLIWGVSLTHPTLASFLYGEFLLHIPCWV